MSDTFLSQSLLDGVGVVTICVLVMWLVVTGRLVTRREHLGTVADRDKWRETAETQNPIIARMVTEAETTNRLLRALPGIAEEFR